MSSEKETNAEKLKQIKRQIIEEKAELPYNIIGRH